MRYKLTIEYDGGPFHGWQRLPDAPTVQGALEDAVEKLTGIRTDVIGAGRTDSGRQNPALQFFDKLPIDKAVRQTDVCRFDDRRSLS